MNTFIGTLAGVWPALFGQIQVLRNFDSLLFFQNEAYTVTRWEVQRLLGLLWTWDDCQLSSGRHQEEVVLSSYGNCAQFKYIIKAILTFFSSFGCIIWSLYFEMLNWPLRVPLNTSAIIKARQAIDWTPVNFAPLHILSSPFLVSQKVLNASSSLPEPSAVWGHYLHISLAGPQHGRLGTRDGRVEGALRENIKVCPVPNVSWDD